MRKKQKNIPLKRFAVRVLELLFLVNGFKAPFGKMIIGLLTLFVLISGISATFNFSAEDEPLICTVGSNPAFTVSCSGGNNYGYEWFKDGVSQIFSNLVTTFYADTCTEGAAFCLILSNDFSVFL